MANDVFPRNRVTAWTVGRTGAVLRCAQGRLWLTRTGDPDDLLIGCGEEVALPPGRWVAQALEDSRFQILIQSRSQEAHHGETIVLPLLQRL